MIKLSITTLEISVKPVKDRNTPDVLARVSITLKEETGKDIVIRGFSLRRSKFNGKPYLVAPSRSLGSGKGFFKYSGIEGSLWKEIEEEATKKYNYEEIPVIE